MKNIFQRFNIKISLQESQERFRNKINNILFHSQLFNNSKFDLGKISYEFCMRYGHVYESYYTFEGKYLSGISFQEYLLRLICIIEILNEKHPDIAAAFCAIIQDFLNQSPADLNLRVVKQKKSYTLFPKGSALLDTTLIDDSLGILVKHEYNGIRTAFEKGLKEFLQASQDKAKLKNCLRDMQLAMDEISKVILKDKNVGLKQLIKNDNWSKTGLNDYFKNMFYNYNEMLDKLSKHSATSKFSEKEVESVVYMTGLFIRLALK